MSFKILLLILIIFSFVNQKIHGIYYNLKSQKFQIPQICLYAYGTDFFIRKENYLDFEIKRILLYNISITVNNYYLVNSFNLSKTKRWQKTRGVEL